MRIILPIIIILIIIIFTIVILNSDYYFVEKFSNSSYEQNTIEDLISVAFIPKNPYLKEQMTEYEIIDIYKKILDRSPTLIELQQKVYLSKDDLIEELYNSSEYDKMIKVQENSAISGVESSIAKRNLMKKIIIIYKKKFVKDPNEKILNPLRDCYIHLRSNIYLFTAFIESSNYKNFENQVLTTITLTKKNLLEIFNSNYNLLELKIKAEEIIKQTKGGLTASKEDIDYNTLKDELNKIVDNKSTSSTTITEPKKNVANVSEVNSYISSSTPVIKEKYENITQQLTGGITGGLTGGITGQISNQISNQLSKMETSKETPKEIPKETSKEKIKKITDDLPENSEVYVRVYNPIKYNQPSYRGESKFQPPICTSLGQKSLETPIFTNSKLLFQGSELDTAFEETQVGSIMPKFIYKEYQDIRIK
jgi:hypothetical protein